MKFRIAAMAALALIASITTAGASLCDGFHRCRCGTTAARLHGLPYEYHGLNLKEAREWYHFRHTSCHAGAVGIPHAHHVYTVLQCNGDGTVRVHDDAGIYTRTLTAGTVFVDPGSGTGSYQFSEEKGGYKTHVAVHYGKKFAHSHHRYRHRGHQVAYYQSAYSHAPSDRFGLGAW